MYSTGYVPHVYELFDDGFFFLQIRLNKNQRRSSSEAKWESKRE